MARMIRKLPPITIPANSKLAPPMMPSVNIMVLRDDMIMVYLDHYIICRTIT